MQLKPAHLIWPVFLVFAALLPRAVGAEFATAQPATGVIHRWTALPATMAPFQQVNLQARVSGYVKSVEVDRGDSVSQGQVLARIEVPELESDLLKVQSELDAAEIELKRLREARAKSPDLVLPQTVDNAQARFLAAKASVDRCNSLLDFAQIKAPFAGTITSRSVDPGAYVAPGGGLLFQLVDARKIRCLVPVTEMETPLAGVGKPVRVGLDAFPGRVFEGKVSRASRALDPQTRTMLVEADLDNAESLILPGMSGTARIGVERRDAAVLVPAAAVVFEKTNAFVFKYQAGKAMKTPVKTGFADGVQIEVPELNAADVLLVVGTQPVADGQEVSVKPAAPAR
jgi:membrane fusion protein (multidrug efflux system)